MFLKYKLVTVKRKYRATDWTSNITHYKESTPPTCYLIFNEKTKIGVRSLYLHICHRNYQGWSWERKKTLSFQTWTLVRSDQSASEICPTVTFLSLACGNSFFLVNIVEFLNQVATTTVCIVTGTDTFWCLQVKNSEKISKDRSILSIFCMLI